MTSESKVGSRCPRSRQTNPAVLPILQPRPPPAGPSTSPQPTPCSSSRGALVLPKSGSRSHVHPQTTAHRHSRLHAETPKSHTHSRMNTHTHTHTPGNTSPSTHNADSSPSIALEAKRDSRVLEAVPWPPPTHTAGSPHPSSSRFSPPAPVLEAWRPPIPQQQPLSACLRAGLAPRTGTGHTLAAFLLSRRPWEGHRGAELGLASSLTSPRKVGLLRREQGAREETGRPWLSSGDPASRSSPTRCSGQLATLLGLSGPLSPPLPNCPDPPGASAAPRTGGTPVSAQVFQPPPPPQLRRLGARTYSVAQTQ